MQSQHKPYAFLLFFFLDLTAAKDLSFLKNKWDGQKSKSKIVIPLNNEVIKIWCTIVRVYKDIVKI